MPNKDDNVIVFHEKTLAFQEKLLLSFDLPHTASQNQVERMENWTPARNSWRHGLDYCQWIEPSTKSNIEN